MLPNINHPNAPHVLILSLDVKVCEMKNTGELIPVTKNKPVFIKKTFANLDEAKEKEKIMLALQEELRKGLENG